jgi:co-chaperonin GroES (HSP10)
MRHEHGSTSIKNDEWLSDQDIGDPKPLPRIPGHFILVRPVSIRGITKGGIILSDATKDDIQSLTTVGRVLSVGETAYTKESIFPPDPFSNEITPWCKVGDYVAYGKFAGIKVRYKGVKVIMLNDDEVLMVVDDPGSLDQHYNLHA